MSASGPGCVKTCTRGACAELFSLFSSFDGACQSGSLLIRRSRDKRSTRKFEVGVFTQPGPISDIAPIGRCQSQSLQNGVTFHFHEEIHAKTFSLPRRPACMPAPNYVKQLVLRCRTEGRLEGKETSMMKSSLLATAILAFALGGAAQAWLLIH